MADSEKLTALKKAYAEIILNTAKEAAARIMVSERKAARHQQELVTAKDEALCMLLRLKQMLDSNVREAEIASSNSQMKIEELEAQLHEAEDIVKDLREELEQVQAKLEKAMNSQLEEPMLRKCCIRNDSQVDSCQCHVRNSDFASTVVRSEEPEQYRNRCTQRIRACERNLLDEKLSPSGRVDDIKSETASKLGGKEMFEIPSLKVDECGGEKNPDIFNTIREYEDSVPSQAVTSFRRKRKRGDRYKKSKAPLFRCTSDQVKETLRAPDLSCSKTTPCSVRNSHHSMDDSYEIEIEAHTDPKYSKDQEFQSEIPETVTGLEFVEVSKKDAEEMKVKPELVIQEIIHAENSEVLCSEVDVVEDNASEATSDAKASGLTEGLPSQPADNKFLKYTFRRKRKREPLNSSVGNSSLENSTLKKNTAEKQNGSAETQQSSVATESSRQSRRLAQVARQLISLSGKKW